MDFAIFPTISRKITHTITEIFSNTPYGEHNSKKKKKENRATRVSSDNRVACGTT